jgi:hypothetical protein
MPPDLMSLPLLLGLVGGAFWIVVFAAVTVAAKTYPYDTETINAAHDKDLLEQYAKSQTKTDGQRVLL